MTLASSLLCSAAARTARESRLSNFGDGELPAAESSMSYTIQHGSLAGSRDCVQDQELETTHPPLCLFLDAVSLACLASTAMNERKAVPIPVFANRAAVPTRPTGNMPSSSALYSAAANIIKQAQNLPGSSGGVNLSSLNAAGVTNPSTTSASARSSGPSYAIVRFSLVNTEEFTAKADGPVDKRVIDVMKKIKGTRYDPTTKRVIFPLEAHDMLQVRCHSVHIFPSFIFGR